MNVRLAHPADYKGIAKVHIDSWKSTYKGIVPDSYLDQLSYEEREELWKRILASAKVWVAENNNHDIVGFINGGQDRSNTAKDDQGEIYAIYILQEYQGRGLGKMLVKALVQHLSSKGMTSMTVLVLEENPARYFYESLGAKKVDSVNIEIGGKPLKEDVLAWDQLPQL